MNDKITYRYDVSSKGLSGFFTHSRGAVATLGANPLASYDNHGNHHLANVIICASGETITFRKSEQDAVFDNVRAATIGKPPQMKANGFWGGTLGASVIEDTYDLGQLPSPLQTACNEHSKGEIER